MPAAEDVGVVRPIRRRGLQYRSLLQRVVSFFALLINLSTVSVIIICKKLRCLSLYKQIHRHSVTLVSTQVSSSEEDATFGSSFTPGKHA